MSVDYAEHAGSVLSTDELETLRLELEGAGYDFEALTRIAPADIAIEVASVLCRKKADRDRRWNAPEHAIYALSVLVMHMITLAWNKAAATRTHSPNALG